MNFHNGIMYETGEIVLNTGKIGVFCKLCSDQAYERTLVLFNIGEVHKKDFLLIQEEWYIKLHLQHIFQTEIKPTAEPQN